MISCVRAMACCAYTFGYRWSNITDNSWADSFPTALTQAPSLLHNLAVALKELSQYAIALKKKIHIAHYRVQIQLHPTHRRRANTRRCVGWSCICHSTRRRPKQINMTRR